MDWNKAYMLLEVASKARELPSLKPIHDEAMKELQEMADDIKPRPKELLPKEPPAQPKPPSDEKVAEEKDDENKPRRV